MASVITPPAKDDEFVDSGSTSDVSGIESRADGLASPQEEKEATSENGTTATEGSEKKRPVGYGPNVAERLANPNIAYGSIGWLIVLHIGAIAAFGYFSWMGLALAVGLHWATGSLGICLGYHRLLTHTGMKTYNWVRYCFAAIGTLAGEGAPLDWVSNHRKHHACSDQEGDPHSPHDGGWWSHMVWLKYATFGDSIEDYYKHWAPDLYRDPVIRRMTPFFVPMNITLGLVLAGIGYAIGGSYMAMSFMLWGLFLRLVLVLHATWMVNSASHMWGYRNYETTDDSRNNWFVAIIAYGEGWHNNHHAYPRMAMHGHKWWEFDITWQAIRVLRAVGLVWDVVDYRNAAEKKAQDEQKKADEEKKAAA